MSYVLPLLPYGESDLEPFISKETVFFHYHKHHMSYVNKLNELLGNSDKILEELIKTSSGPIFNQAAQVWNHNFYWQSLTNQFNQHPSGTLLDAINRDFENFENFKSIFQSTSLSQFASGWVWLILDEDKKLKIISTSNADNPIKYNQIPLLVCDVWEHAYYIDTRNDRLAYVKNFWSVVNFAFAQQNYTNAMI